MKSKKNTDILFREDFDVERFSFLFYSRISVSFVGKIGMNTVWRVPMNMNQKMR